MEVRKIKRQRECVREREKQIDKREGQREKEIERVGQIVCMFGWFLNVLVNY